MQERAEKLAPAAALALYLVLLGTVLVLDDGSGYETRLYLYNGALVEEYAAADTDYRPAAAEKVADTRTFTVVQDGARYIITTDDGEVHVTLHSAGRADE